ncbi:periplasmic protein TonB [Burkholderiales bacterium JOSHI_001]|nr:periplasmic protein TonB [Burkholderiales bacterium JOSHI_001]
MASLAEDRFDDSSGARPTRRVAQVGMALLGLVAVGALAYGLKNLIGSGPPEAKRQVARISILPDKPPPPPPPKEEKRPEPPKAESRPVPQDQTPKPVDAPKPANEPIKMEGQAGDSPSAFSAGTVSQDYERGTPSTGPAAASAPAAPAAPSVTDRAAERLYAGSARNLLRDELERRFKSDAEQATATFSLWVEPDGAIRRIELQRTGDARLDGELDSALGDTTRSLKLPPPPAMAQPMKFRLTLRPQG